MALLREQSEEKKRHLHEVEGLEATKSALQEALDAARRQLERVEAQLHDLEEDTRLHSSQVPQPKLGLYFGGGGGGLLERPLAIAGTASALWP